MSLRTVARKFFIGSLYLGVIALVFGLSGAFATWLYIKAEVQGEVVDLPDLFGKTEAEALDIAQMLELELVIDNTLVHDKIVEKGRVLAQLPLNRDNRKIKKGRTIEITLSAGPEQKLIPEMLGETLSFSHELLTESGTVAQVVSRMPSNLDTRGRVLQQVPDSGKALDLRSGVSLLISDGPQAQYYVTPDLVGRDYLTVKNLLEKHELRMITRYRAQDAEMGQTILEQSPKPGFPLAQTQTITLIVNKDY